MTSQMMLEDAEDLAKRGITLTPREVVRLNALGLKVERGPRTTAYFSVRRVCICGDITLHEPTIGHYAWLDRADNIVDTGDVQTWFVLRAYWLSVLDPDDLVKLDDARAVERTVLDFGNGALRGHTVREIRAAMDYVENGANEADGERGPKRERKDDEDNSIDMTDWCTEIGIVHKAQALGLGIALKDALSMTPAQLRSVIDQAERRISGDTRGAYDDAVGDYQLVLDEIVARHEAEAKEMTNG